jgi:hypothetical protein
MHHSESILKISPAIVAAQAELRAAPKDSANPFFKSHYADLASCMEALRAVLHKAKLAILQFPSVIEEGRIVSVETTLIHESGEWFSCSLSCQPKDAGPQSIGSAITYLRRYGLALTGLVTDEDDDGNTAQGNQGTPSDAKKDAKAATPSAPKAAPQGQQPKPTDAEVNASQDDRHFLGVVKSITPPRPDQKYKFWLVTFEDGRKCATYEEDTGVSLIGMEGRCLEMDCKKTKTGNFTFIEFTIMKEDATGGNPDLQPEKLPF